MDFKFIENIHSEMYSLLIDTIFVIINVKMIYSLDRIPCIAKKAEWALKYIESDDAIC